LEALTFVTSAVLPDPLGPQTRNFGDDEGALARYRNKWRRMGSDITTRNVKMMLV
jgi:hypothetical protein